MCDSEFLQLLAELEAASTPGPWRARCIDDPQWWVTNGDHEFALVCVTSHGNDEANAKFIAVAREAVPLLVTEVKSLRAKLDECRSDLAKAVGIYPEEDS